MRSALVVFNLQTQTQHIHQFIHIKLPIWSFEFQKLGSSYNRAKRRLKLANAINNSPLICMIWKYSRLSIELCNMIIQLILVKRTKCMLHASRDNTDKQISDCETHENCTCVHYTCIMVATRIQYVPLNSIWLMMSLHMHLFPQSVGFISAENHCSVALRTILWKRESNTWCLSHGLLTAAIPAFRT